MTIIKIKIFFFSLIKWLKKKVQYERWYIIDNFPNYQISCSGRVKEKETKQILSSNKDRYGYFKVVLRKDKNKYTKLIHLLVAEHFLVNIQQYPIVKHIDGDKNNNKLSNLLWVPKLMKNT